MCCADHATRCCFLRVLGDLPITISSTVEIPLRGKLPARLAFSRKRSSAGIAQDSNCIGAGWHSVRRGGRQTSKKLREIIFRMAAENLTWGAPRIHGELNMLGFDISERTVLHRMRKAPRHQLARVVVCSPILLELFGDLYCVS